MHPEVIEPVGFRGWGDSFGRIAPRYEELAFSAGSTALLGELELQAMHRSLGRLRAADVLDLGAGSGRVTRSLLDAGAAVTAVDASAAMLGELGLATPGVARVVGRFGDPLPFRDGSFDVVVALRVLKYVDDPFLALIEVARVLRPGGRAVLEWTNRHSLARLGYGSAPIRFMDQRELARLCVGSGLEVLATAPGSRLPHALWRAACSRPARTALLGAEAALAGMARPLPGPAGARSAITTLAKVQP